MKTDVIRIKGNGDGIERALTETEKAAVYCGLEKKQALRLRLLAEEMTGMLRTIVGDQGEYLYWIENDGPDFELHLSCDARVDRDTRKELLKSASSGHNEAAHGFMGMIKDVLIQMRSSGEPVYFARYGYMYEDICGFDAAAPYSAAAVCDAWSLSAYRGEVEKRKQDELEKWDQLERSITANIADDIKIAIRGGSVEMVVEKTF